MEGFKSFSFESPAHGVLFSYIQQYLYTRYSKVFTGDTMEAYCVKCKEKREMNKVKEVRSKNGRKMAKGVCPVCGTKMNKFLKG